MTHQTSDLQTLGRVLYEEAAAVAGDHPELETLLDYSADRLDAGAETRVRDHMVGCTDCAETFLDLETVASPEVPREGVADLATAAAWREMRGRLFTPQPAARPQRGWQWSHAVAVAALVPIIGLSAWVAQLHGSTVVLSGQVAELTRPQPNLSTFYFGEVVRSAGEEVIEVPAGVTRFAVIFNSPELGDYGYEQYDVRFFDREGTEVLSVDKLFLMDGYALRMGLTRGNPPAGEYLVEVRGFDGKTWQKVEEHRRQIVYLEER